MSAAKYANLPDIDTAQDVYETPDVAPTGTAENEYSDGDDIMHPSRSRRHGATAPTVNPEEMDTSSFMSPNEAAARFRKAEKKSDRARTLYAYPPSPTSPTEPAHQPPLAQRIQMLRAELAALEAEVSDPSNPQLNSGETDAGEMIRDLVGVKGRLEKLSSRKEGRERLIELITMAQASGALAVPPSAGATASDARAPSSDEMTLLAEIDKRVGELEKLVGSSSAALDETSQLPPPLLPLLNRLSAQLTLLTQPRHIDSISRRLKLLLADLERTGGASAGSAAGSRRQPSQASAPSAPTPPSNLQADILPLLTRLSPHLPTLPHILTRLRTLSALHISAAAFETTLKDLEDEQKKVRVGLTELSSAVDRVEKTFNDNETMTSQNVKGLEQRIDSLMGRLEALSQ
ncbi:hypothetical protein AURDEDRAFT_82301 [Auricularia subglabra TFB-10046 SS5]|nr:hypothetical protein AURDEDRAFT_82301 [Auricularia subglabra TFB-10046 SS5]